MNMTKISPSQVHIDERMEPIYDSVHIHPVVAREIINDIEDGIWDGIENLIFDPYYGILDNARNKRTI